MSVLKVGDIVYQFQGKQKFTGPCEILQIDLEPSTGAQVLLKGYGRNGDRTSWLPAECVQVEPINQAAELLKGLGAAPFRDVLDFVLHCDNCGEVVAPLHDHKCGTEYDMINPSHYKDQPIETIDMMVRIWGEVNTSIYCDMNAFKYRMRCGNKPGNSGTQDLDKAKWYEAKSKELRA